MKVEGWPLRLWWRYRLGRLEGALAQLRRRESYVVVTMDDVLPMYGEGRTRDEAVTDLLGSLVSLRAMLEEDPSKLSPQLAYELRILRRLMAPSEPAVVTVTSGPVSTITTSNRSTPEVWRDNEERPAAREEKP